MVARVLVVLSDGQNNAGEVSLEGAIDAAQEAEVTIYAISTNYSMGSLGTHDFAASQGNWISASWRSRLAVECSIRPIQRQWQKLLPKSARSCAADTLFPTSRQISRPTDAFEESTLKLEKTGEKLEVHARKGYFARAASRLSSDTPETSPHSPALELTLPL